MSQNAAKLRLGGSKRPYREQIANIEPFAECKWSTYRFLVMPSGVNWKAAVYQKTPGGPVLQDGEDVHQQALTLANELGMRPLQAHCHQGLGTLYRQTDQTEQARTELSTAIEMNRDMEMNFWLPETETALTAVEGR